MKIQNVRVCPYCGSEGFSMVTNSRFRQGSIMRRRKCLNCKKRWSSIEITMDDFERFEQLIENYEQIIDLTGRQND